MKQYKLYRLIGGEWWYWGTYNNPVSLAKAANELGKAGYEIRVEVVRDDPV